MKTVGFGVCMLMGQVCVPMWCTFILHSIYFCSGKVVAYLDTISKLWMIGSIMYSC